MYQHNDTTDRHTLDDLLDRIYAQQLLIRNTCPCGKPGKVYADDGRATLCGKCYLKIYHPGRCNDE